METGVRNSLLYQIVHPEGRSQVALSGAAQLGCVALGAAALSLFRSGSGTHLIGRLLPVVPSLFATAAVHLGVRHTLSLSVESEERGAALVTLREVHAADLAVHAADLAADAAAKVASAAEVEKLRRQLGAELVTVHGLRASDAAKDGLLAGIRRDREQDQVALLAEFDSAIGAVRSACEAGEPHKAAAEVARAALLKELHTAASAGRARNSTVLVDAFLGVTKRSGDTTMLQGAASAAMALSSRANAAQWAVVAADRAAVRPNPYSAVIGWYVAELAKQLAPGMHPTHGRTTEGYYVSLNGTEFIHRVPGATKWDQPFLLVYEQEVSGTSCVRPVWVQKNKEGHLVKVGSGNIPLLWDGVRSAVAVASGAVPSSVTNFGGRALSLGFSALLGGGKLVAGLASAASATTASRAVGIKSWVARRRTPPTYSTYQSLVAAQEAGTLAATHRAKIAILDLAGGGQDTQHVFEPLKPGVKPWRVQNGIFYESALSCEVDGSVRLYIVEKGGPSGDGWVEKQTPRAAVAVHVRAPVREGERVRA